MPSYSVERSELQQTIADAIDRGERLLYTETDHTNNRMVKVVTSKPEAKP